MTLARTIATGSGPYELRLVISGWPYEFCTQGLATGTLSDGRERVGGLIPRGLRKKEDCRLVDGIPKLSGMTANLVDLQEKCTVAFTTEPTLVQYLDGSVTSSGTTFTVQDSTPFSTNAYYHIGAETVKVTAKPTGTTLTVTRAQWDTSGKAHSSVPGGNAIWPEITDVPTMMVGRRAAIYLHGPTELTTSDAGSVVWRGRVSAEPRCIDMAQWGISLEGLDAILDQDIGGDFEDPIRLTGIYYAWNAPFVMYFQEHTGNTLDSTADKREVISLYGFYADQGAFVDALQSAIDGQTASWSNTIRVKSDGDSGFTIGFLTDSGGAKFLVAQMKNWFDGQLEIYPTDVTTEDRIAVLDNGAEYVFGWNDEPQGPFENPGPSPRTVPRANYMQDGTLSQYWGDDTSAPSNVIYLDKAHRLSAGSVLHVDSSYVPLRVDSVSATTGAVTLATSSGRPQFIFERWTARSGPGIHAMNVISSNGAPGDLDDFRSALISLGASSTLGTIPFITSDDLASWTTVIDAIKNGRPYLERIHFAFRKTMSLKKLMQHLLRLHGCFLYTDSSAKLAIRELRFAAPTEVDYSQIDDDDYVITSDFGRLNIAPDHYVNVVKLKTQWDAEEEKHMHTFTLRDVQSISRLGGKTREVEIAAPVALDTPITKLEDAVAIADPILTMLATRYYVLDCGVTWKHFALTCGDTVRVVVGHVPEDGQRGLDKVGTVIGYDWPLDKAEGRVQILLIGQRIAGYAPTGRIASVSGSGTAWTVTLSASHYAPSGTNDVDWFTVGDRITLREWDNTVPTTRDGTIDAISGNDIDVTLDSSWSGLGGATYNIEFTDQSDVAASGNSAQLDFCYIADSSLNIGTSTPARIFAS